MRYNEKIKELVLELYPGNSLYNSCSKCGDDLGYSPFTIHKSCGSSGYKGRKALFKLLSLLKEKKDKQFAENELYILRQEKNSLEKEKNIIKRVLIKHMSLMLKRLKLAREFNNEKRILIENTEYIENSLKTLSEVI